METRVKAWMFQIEKKFYQVIETNGGYGIPAQTCIYDCNKRGKRSVQKAVFIRNGANHLSGINEFIDKLEESEKQTQDE